MSKKRRRAHKVAAPPLTTVSVRRPLFSDEAVARMVAVSAPKPMTADIFAPAKPPRGVVPEGQLIAMDWSPDLSSGWAPETSWANLGGYGAAIPMQVLATWAQRPEFRKIAEVFAVEMTRRWIKVGSTNNDGGSGDRVDGINAALRTYRVRDAFRDAIRFDGEMGRGHVFIDLGTSGSELATPIGNGADAATKQKVKKGSLKGIRAADPMWIYPQGYNARNPLALDFYNPQTWYVMAEPVHATRLLTIVAREVPDILKPAYSFGGLSLTQMAQPYVDNWLRTRQSVADIVNAFSVFVLSTNMATGLMGGGSAFGGANMNDGAGLDARAMLFNLTRDNRGLMLIDKDQEAFQNVSANLGTLDKLQAQAQEQMASVASIPLVKLLGVTPSGLNASSDGEVRTFYDTIHAAQEDHLRDPLQTIIDIIQLSEFGDIDDSITFSFEPLWAMSEKEGAEVEKLEAETDQIHVDSGVLWNHEVRKQLASDPDSRYPGLDVDDAPDLNAEEAEGLEPEGPKGEDALDRMFDRA